MTGTIDCYPYKWPPFYSSTNDTSSISELQFPSSIINSRESVDGTEKSKDCGRDRRETAEENEDTDDETERVLEEAFRTSSDDSEVPKNVPEIRPADEMNLRRYDFTHRTRPSNHNFGDRIVFPDHVEAMNPSIFPEVPQCRHGSFCENAEFYPTELINRVVNSDKNLKFLQIRDELEDTQPTLTLRSSGRERTLCESKKHLIRPKRYLNKDNKWRYVINTPDFIQEIAVEICENDQSPCKLVDNFATGWKTMCKQNYIYRKLVAILSPNETSSEFFRIPASCCCQIQFIGDPTLRMGIDLRKNES